MLNDLDQWLNVTKNFNLFVGVAIFVGLLSVVVYTLFLNKIGKKDEYTLRIRLNVTNNMFITLVITVTAFILLTSNGFVHYSQLIIACFIIAILVGAISSVYYYYRDFKN